MALLSAEPSHAPARPSQTGADHKQRPLHVASLQEATLLRMEMPIIAWEEGYLGEEEQLYRIASMQHQHELS